MMTPAFYRGDTAISPHRQRLKSHGDLTASKMKTKELVQDVQDEVEADFTLHYRVTDTKQFLDKLLPVEKSTIDQILQHMKDEQIYDSQTQRWTGFPDPTRQESRLEKKKPKENSLYGPFCAIAEAIRTFAEKQARSSVSGMGTTKWVDYHSKSPRSWDSRAAQLRPDALFALQAIAERTVLKKSQVRIRFESISDADRS